MSGIRSITRRPTVVGSASAGSAPIYVDSDDNILKMIPAGSGTSEVQLVDASSSQTLTSKVLTSPTITTGITPTITDGAALGSGTLMFSDLFLASGGIVDWNNGNVKITHAAGKLTATFPAPTGSIDCLTASFTSGSATPGTCRAIVGSATSFTSMTSGGLVGVRGVVTQAAAVSGASNYGCQGKYVTGAFSAAGTLAAVYAQFDMTGGTIGAGNIAAIQANIVGCASGTVALNGLYVEQAGGGAINSYGRFLGNSTFVFDIESSYTNQSTTGTAGATAAKGWLKVQITNGSGTVTRYIPLTDSVS